MANCADILVLFTLSVLLKNLTAHAAPLAGIVYDPEEAAGMTEGDMVLSDEQKAFLTNPIMGRNGLIAATKRWPKRIVHYKIIGVFDAPHRAAIQDAIDTLQERTCITFQEADEHQPHYVAISSKAGGCYTAVGYQAKVQEMNLENYPIGEGCFRPGTVLHEFMHALGFYHQQSDANRDNYITVIYDNIVPGKEFNFRKYDATVVTDFGVGYDYDSCLHYRPGAFSSNGEDTIVPMDQQAKIGQRDGMSKKDVDKINLMYKCPIKM